MKTLKKIGLFTALVLSIMQSTSQNAENFPWRGFAKTPPMGWNSYNCFGAAVRESEIKANTDFMASKLKQFGWEYIVVDFCWFYPHTIKSTQSNPPQFRLKDGTYQPWLAMDEYARLLPDQKKFPSAKEGVGFKALADYVHSKGLKFGIHIMRGIPRQAVFEKTPIKGAPGIDASMIADTTSTCNWLNNMYGVDMSKKGAQEYYNSLFEMYAAWGVDFVKVDDISGGGKTPYYAKEVEAVRKAIDKCGRPMVLSLSLYMKYNDREHLLNHANMWRVSHDFWDEWKPLKEQFEMCYQWEKSKTVGSWPDADMLQLGVIARRGPVGVERETKFTQDEQKTHYSLWAIAKSPLMMGGDMTVSKPSVIAILSNKDLIDMNQQGENSHQVSRNENEAIWTSEVPSLKTKYVAVFNLSDAQRTIQVNLKSIGVKKGSSVKELWEQKEMGKSKDAMSVSVPLHGCVVFKFTQK